VAVRDGTPLLSELLRTHRVNHAAYVSINVFCGLLVDERHRSGALRCARHTKVVA